MPLPPKKTVKKTSPKKTTAKTGYRKTEAITGPSKTLARTGYRRTEGTSEPFKASKNTGYRRTERPTEPSKNSRKTNYRRAEGTTDYRKNEATTEPSKYIRLNKLISNAGVCARRAADTLIQAGKITVNGQVLTTLGYKVLPSDVVQYQGRTLKASKSVYVLLNKPKDYITTTQDPQGRKTVLELIKSAGPERIYPVGRLDRNTTGLLLLTNDGDLAKRLAHPAGNVKKLYHVVLDKPLSEEDFDQVKAGVMLEDGVAAVDRLEIVDRNRSSIGLEIHMGRNRVVRRIFEHLGYEVIKLDRVMYSHLTKKDLPRGKWRMLTDREVRQLKHL